MIREAVVSDCEQIQYLCEYGLGYACDKELVKMRLSNLDPDRECVFVAVSDGKVTGFIHVEKYELLYAPGMANILGIAVLSEFRRQGIGKRLLTAAEEWAKSRGIHTMRLNSGGTRKEAHMFYRSLGYSNEKEQLRFIKEIL